MALQGSSKEGIIYLSIAEGKLRQKVNEETEGAIKRSGEINGEKWVKYEKAYNKVSGFLSKIEYQEHDQFGNSINIIIEDEVDGKPEIYQIQVSEDSRYFQTFAQVLPNIDFGGMIELKPYSFKEQGSEYTIMGITIYQDGEKVDNFYKVWDSKKEKSTYMNGLEKYDFSKCKTKKDKKILKIQLTAFLVEEVLKQAAKLKEFIESLEDEEQSSKDDDPEV